MQYQPRRDRGTFTAESDGLESIFSSEMFGRQVFNTGLEDKEEFYSNLRVSIFDIEEARTNALSM